MSDVIAFDAPVTASSPTTQPLNAPPQRDVMQPVSRTGNDGYDNTPIAQRDWSFLSEEGERKEFDPEETLDEFVARQEAEQEAIQSPTPEPEAAKADDATPEAEKPVEAAVDPEMKEKAEHWDRFSNLIDKSPETLVEWAIGRMGEGQKDAIRKSLNAAPIAQVNLPDIDPATYQPAEGMEEALLPRWQDIKSIPEMRQEIAQLKASLASAGQAEVRSLHEPIGLSLVHGEIALSMIGAIADAMGLDLPMPDLKAISDALQDGRTTHKSAVAKVIGASYKQKAAEHKQKGAERPKTPGNSSTQKPVIKPGMSMAQLIQQGVQ